LRFNFGGDFQNKSIGTSLNCVLVVSELDSRHNTTQHNTTHVTLERSQSQIGQNSIDFDFFTWKAFDL